MSLFKFVEVANKFRLSWYNVFAWQNLKFPQMIFTIKIIIFMYYQEIVCFISSEIFIAVFRIVEISKTI